ncbi:MAG TPA: PAS domain S-box protein [Methylococcaceae bacterium]|nr:PAS domain S-box protein [Methylococcaceae bacterium]
MKTRIPPGIPRPLLALLPPLAACFLQWQFWAVIRPSAWLLFYPAVFCSSWIGGPFAGLIATVLSTALAWWFFIPPEYGFSKADPESIVSAAVFVGMGILFSHGHARLRQATQQAAESREAAHDANDRLQVAALEAARRALHSVQALPLHSAPLDLFPQPAVATEVAPLTLVVEDNPDMNAILAEALGRRYRVVTAFDGQEGLAKALELRPDLIVTDLMMPGMNGDSMLRQLRGHGQLRDTPVVVLTASADEDLRVKLLQEGVQDYVHKPFLVEELLTRADRLLSERKRTRDRFEMLVRSSPNGIVLVDRDGRIVLFNAALEKMFGYPRAELLGQTVELLVPERLRERHVQSRREFSAHPEIRAMGARRDLSGRHKDGREIPVEIGLTPVDTEQGPMVLTTIIDITQRKQAENEIRERTTQLEAINRELETFTYSVSHDLKAPLRGIDGYSRLLLEDHAAQLDEEGRKFLANVRHGAQQMGQLIEDLLAYSRMERRSMQKNPIALADLVRAVVGEMDDEIRSRSVELRLEVPPLLAHADPDGLLCVLRNVLGNALKFSRDAKPPLVEIGGREENDTVLIWVKDNGIGFDVKFHERIFEIFQRLQRSEDYPGTGIGLAIVKKAMQRMGGQVWAESTPGAGATFFMRLPGVAPPHAESAGTAESNGAPP